MKNIHSKILTIYFIWCASINFVISADNADDDYVNIVSSKAVFNLGDVNLSTTIFDPLTQFRAQLAALQAEMEAIKADGLITEEEAVQITSIKASVDVTKAQMDAYIVSQIGSTRWGEPGPITLSITGTSGKAVSLTIEDVTLLSEPKYGPGVGSLTATTGVIPFDVTFTPSNNYGSCKIVAKLVDTPTITDSCMQTIKGQSKAAALALENTRFNTINSGVDTQKELATAIIGVFSLLIVGLITIALGSALASTIVVVFAIAALGIALGVAGTKLVSLLDATKDLNLVIHTSNLQFIEATIPSVP